MAKSIHTNTMVVLYYTSTSFLDVVIETIQSLKHKVELHVFIEISEASKQRGTIVSVNDLSGMKYIEDPEVLLGKEKWALLQPYFDGVAAVKFVVHKQIRSISLHTLRRGIEVGQYLKKHKVDVVHFDTISTRAIGMYPYLLSRKVMITLHDPAPHSGEHDWRDNLPNRIFLPMAKAFFFYSEFAGQQFRQHFPKIKRPVYILRLHPYTYVSKLLTYPPPAAESILFFGRLSYYKGIDLLLDAIPQVLAVYPQQKFVIAGNAAYGYEIKKEVIEKYPDNITVISKYLATEDLVRLIQQAKFVVCPYRDATQSGVLMTAQAAGKMVIATDVGSFSEYIEDGVNGMLAAPEPAAIAAKMNEALADDKYSAIEKKLDPCFSKRSGDHNEQNLLAAYNAAMIKR